MEKIAFLLNGTAIGWSGMILILAALGAVLLFLGLYLGKTGNPAAAFAAVPLALLLSVLFARLLHWYCYAETYDSLFSAVTDYSSGGFGLLGAFAGCFAAALITRLFKLHRSLPAMLDCMCLAGLAGISAGRLSAFFSTSDRGQVLASLRSLPLAYPVTNAVSGATEYRLATFALQALVTALLFIGLWLFFRRKTSPEGDTALLFALFYGCAEVILDSTRYDSMYFRWNGFVSIVQVVGALALVFSIVVFSRRLVKKRGFRPVYAAIWGLILCGIGGAGYMEYHVQRHGSEALFAYSVMSACLVLVACLTLVIRHMAEKKPAAAAAGRYLRA